MTAVSKRVAGMASVFVAVCAAALLAPTRPATADAKGCGEAGSIWALNLVSVTRVDSGDTASASVEEGKWLVDGDLEQFSDSLPWVEVWNAEPGVGIWLEER